jgi:hypothetical protein
VSSRIITLAIQCRGIITPRTTSTSTLRRRRDQIRSVIAIEIVQAAIGQITRPPARRGRSRYLDETLSENDAINQNIRDIRDAQAGEWGIKVTVVELRGIQLAQRHAARDDPADRG